MANSTCLSFPDKPEHCDTLVAVRRTFGSISLIGCLFMIFIIWLFRRYVAFSQRLILYLSIGSSLKSIAFLMAAQEDGSYCDFQGWFMMFFSWQVLLWVTCITFNLFMTVMKLTTTEKYEWLYCVVCWALPLFVSCLPFIGDHYGMSGAWCWLKPNTSWRIGIWYGPLIIIFTGLTITYTYITYSLNRKASRWQGTYDPDTDREHQLLKEDIAPLRAYPFVYLATMIFPLINRIQNAISPDYHIFTLALLASITSPLHGLLNALVFGLNKETIQKLSPSQIKSAIQSRTSQQQPVREYPYSYATFLLSDSEAFLSEEETLNTAREIRGEKQKFFQEG